LSITPDEVRRIAELAQMELEESELETCGDQLGRILDFFAQIDDLDPGDPVGVEPPGRSRELRPDRPGRSLNSIQATDPAPDRSAGHFRIPKVIDR
jgi:aspartyl-tRNA(Asn)/glutamyl-tRNA(Gln) amidotransferase subunit C